MNIYTQSDKAIAEQLGQRIKNRRLQQNLTQKALADKTQLSLNAIKSLEQGRCNLSTLIAALRELQALDQLDHFIPAVSISPLQIAKNQGKQRQRASGERIKSKPDSVEREEW